MECVLSSRIPLHLLSCYYSLAIVCKFTQHLSLPPQSRSGHVMAIFKTCYCRHAMLNHHFSYPYVVPNTSVLLDHKNQVARNCINVLMSFLAAIIDQNFSTNLKLNSLKGQFGY